MRAIVHSTGSGWQKRYQEFFCDGLNKHGISVGVSRLADCAPADFHVIFANNSWMKTLGACRMKGIPCLTVNRCFFGDRHDNVAIGWDGFNGRANFMNAESPEDRWLQHGVPVAPWKKDDGYILVLGEYRDMTEWYAQVARDISLSEWKNHDVLFRPHPFKQGQTHQGWNIAPGKAQDDIETALARAALCITYDTIGGVDALIAGVATVAYGEYSMARPIAASGLRPIYWYRDRLPWLQDLAYAQWYYKEISSGEFWEHLGSRVVDPAAAI